MCLAWWNYIYNRYEPWNLHQRVSLYIYTYLVLGGGIAKAIRKQASEKCEQLHHGTWLLTSTHADFSCQYPATCRVYCKLSSALTVPNEGAILIIFDWSPAKTPHTEKLLDSKIDKAGAKVSQRRRFYFLLTVKWNTQIGTFSRFAMIVILTMIESNLVTLIR